MSRIVKSWYGIVAQRACAANISAIEQKIFHCWCQSIETVKRVLWKSISFPAEDVQRRAFECCVICVYSVPFYMCVLCTYVYLITLESKKVRLQQLFIFSSHYSSCWWSCAQEHSCCNMHKVNRPLLTQHWRLPQRCSDGVAVQMFDTVRRKISGI